LWQTLIINWIKRESTWILVALCLSYVLFYMSPIEEYKLSDPLGTLLVSQSILENGTVTLDSYPEYILDRFDWHLHQIEGHTYYGYPLGTSVFMIPFVALANLTHMDMKRMDHELILQGRLAALSATLAMLLIYLLARCYFGPKVSIFLTLILTFGSAVSSTLAVGLWSMNLSVLFLLWSLLLLVKDSRGIKKLNPYLLGFLLFSAFFCRPTTAIYIFLIMAYLFIKNRRVFLNSALVFLPCLAALIFFSLKVYHNVYPSNYDFKFGGYGYTNFRWEVFYGHLLSPSRGILVYSPFLIVSLLGIFVFFKKTRKDLLLWAMFAGFVFHLCLLSTWRMWWGGGGFGNRLLSDSYPALVFIILISFQYFIAMKSRFGRYFLCSLFTLLGLFSIYVNTIQGLYNEKTQNWNRMLHPEEEKSYLFNWSNAQFLGKSVYMEPGKFTSSYGFVEEIFPDSENIQFEAWYPVEHSEFGSFRWSSKKKARICFNIKKEDLLIHERLVVLEIRAGTFRAQRVQVSINGQRVGRIKNQKDTTPHEYTFAFTPHFIEETNPGQFHRYCVEFSIPGAISPSEIENANQEDKRILGLSFYSLKLKIN